MFEDFNSRLRKAVESGEPAAIIALYRTNGVSAELLQAEFSRWKAVLAGDAKTVGTAFKELSKLPPQAQKLWTKEARRFTEHEVTHIAIVGTAGGAKVTLPLVAKDGKLLIVPSEKISPGGIGPNGPPEKSQAR